MTTNTAFRPRRDFSALEERRMKAVRLFEQGKPQAEVVRLLKVSRPSAFRWFHAWKREGRTALKAAGRAGRKPRLDETSKKRLAKVLLGGPQAAGFTTNLWTLERVTAVIGKTCGVKYHPCHVGRLLHSLGWSRQRPARIAKEKNTRATARWVAKDWPRVKKTPVA